MTSEERQQEILRHVLARRTVKVKDLAQEYGVHEMTIRRDLDVLAENGRIRRVHGGARLGERAGEEVSYSLRRGQNIEAKNRIAAAALTMISDGDVIALDASTTSLALARQLGQRDVQVIVTSLDIAETLAAQGVRFILAGGLFHAPARSFVGPLTERALAGLNVDKAFFSARGFTAEAGFSDPHLPEVEVKASLIRRAGTVVALMDRSKFGRTALARIASVDEIDVLITECGIDSRFVHMFESNGIDIVLAE